MRASEPTTAGFTLVELAIVLVIIGLLIGGILVAQSMISTSKIQSVVRQLSQYDVAISNFQTKYDQLPGDSSLFIPPQNWQGDKNGLVDTMHETYMAWWQLSQGVGIKNVNGTDYVTYSCCPPSTAPSESNFPRFKLDQDMTNPPFLYIQSWDRSSTVPMRLGYIYVAWPDANPDAVDVHSYPLSGPAALALDAKMDNGVSTSGNTWGFGQDADGNPCEAGGVYSSSRSYVCGLYISRPSGQIIN